MDVSTLKALGLTLRQAHGSWEAELELSSSLINPLNQKIISRVTFTPAGERLAPAGPPEVVGLPPLAVQGVTRASELEHALSAAFDEYVFLLQRRSEELQSLGIGPHIQPETLLLTAEVQVDVYLFTLALDRRGGFRVESVQKDGQPLRIELGQPFELAEFRERQALGGYLLALVNAAAPAPSAARGAPSRAIRFEEVAQRFGEGAHLPSLSSLELLVNMSVAGVRYRFAAARVRGRTFRGLLAGPQGKLWAERFELEEFPGPEALLAGALAVPVETVELLGPDTEAS